MEDEEAPPNYLGLLGLKIKWHWQEAPPADVLGAGAARATPPGAAAGAEPDVGRALHSLLKQGVPYDQAWASVREEWAFLPSEADEPAL